MILSILFFAVILLVKGRELPGGKITAVYVSLGILSIGILLIRSFADIPYFAEWLLGYY